MANEISKLKILIIEDNEMHLTAMRDELIANFPEDVVIFPLIPELNESFDSANIYVFLPLIQALREEKFETVIRHYSDIDIFVIDVALNGDKDKIGIELCKQINETDLAKTPVKIVVSQYGSLEDEVKRLGAYFIWKAEYDNFEYEVVELIRKIMGDDKL